ncbi:histidine kinase [Paenibacillus barcinonensis]|uniref:Histidine kinase n=1 Tax=Paenibacillus barcinonensis TaxID=198119 RepID=A0A2V4V9A1_PAEBA|nr:histidine kinase [Paenibacillus barcinonensis]PYE45446.1 two-component system sensor histidine kinase YesM [Paenibacillus barcinonensis]QKS55261.1 histidine kinase [Paenibacillus barcinonensis]
MIRKMYMRRFIYFFVFFLLLTLSLFYVMNRSSSKTLEENLISASKNQLEYVTGIIDGIIYEANMYGVQFAADNDVRFYQNQLVELSNYDSQMKKNEIVDRLRQTLLSSRSIESIGIYWKSQETFLSTHNSSEMRQIFKSVEERGWQIVNNSLYYFVIYPYIQKPGTVEPTQYIVGVKLKTDYLKSMLKKAINNNSSNAFYLFKNQELWSEKAVEASLLKTVTDLLVPQQASTVKYDYHNPSEDYYVLSRYVEPIDAYLITYTRTNDFLKPLDRSRSVFLASIIAVLTLGLIVIFTFYRNYYRNLRLLEKKFSQVEQGNHHTRIQVHTGREFFSLFRGFNHMVSEIQDLFVSLKTETQLRRTAELKQLQAQINPHFLYNSLFFITSAAQFSPDAVMRMSKHLAEYYRYLTKLDRHEVTLGSELQFAEHYLIIMALSKKMDYSIQTPNDLTSFSLPPLMIQPIVENAIQHGIEGRQGAHQVKIDVVETREGIQIEVSDDGKGLSPEHMYNLQAELDQDTAPEGSRGMGLYNVNKRLKNTYGEQAGLHFASNSWGGLSILLLIPEHAEKG